VYQDYFGLNCKPFGIVPDTRFLFLSDSHREAIAHLVYALNEKNGFVQLTGEVGVGKTMACRYILANIPEDIDVALILNPRIDEIGLLRMLCQEMHIEYDKDQQPNELTRLINDKLLKSYAANRHTILIIDEAQNLPKRTLEQLRLLTNLETDTQKLLRIILIGQPELGELLAEYDMRQVAQRITSRYHLTTLGPDETDDYIHHRLRVAGCNQRLFSRNACRKAHKLTQGTPRLLNLLCDRALIAAYSRGEPEVNARLIKQAAVEALPFIKPKKTAKSSNWLIAALLLLILVMGALMISRPDWRDPILQYWQSPQATTTPTTAVPPVMPSDKIKATASNPIKAEPVAPSKAESPVTAAAAIATSPDAGNTSTTSTGAGRNAGDFDNTDLRDNESPAPASNIQTGPDGISPAQLEEMKKQADVDFRMGIPPTVDSPEQN